MDRQRVLVYAVLVSIQAVFAGWNLIGKAVFNRKLISPVAFALLRELISTGIMIGSALVMKVSLVVQREDYVKIVVLGTIGIFYNQLSFVYGLAYTNALTAGMFQPLLPLCTALLAALLLNVIPLRRQLFGLSISIIGAILVIYASHEEEAEEGTTVSWQFVGGVVLLITNLLSVGYSLVLQKELLPKYSWISITVVSYAVGAVEMVFASLIIDGPNGLSKVTFSPFLIWSLIYVIVLATCFNYLMMTWANSKATATTVASFVVVNPVVTTILAHYLLNENVTPLHIFGFLCISCGLVFFLQYAPIEKTGSGGFSPLEEPQSPASIELSVVSSDTALHYGLSE